LLPYGSRRSDLIRIACSIILITFEELPWALAVHGRHRACLHHRQFDDAHQKVIAMHIARTRALNDIAVATLEKSWIASVGAID
jgi:hypothetical protein